ncbi:hypothetical protein [Deinococcus knuensis]|uniref:HAD family hydrolase n=1 Tax=Deinococcus knuensis TaxID=1837380 RepID=A0ABQ2SXV3_9DEIO|nr:hypothetical protein [Deinococcus knuensis]GGS41564.1 hypothetical protein GCM10008961_35990 [Deinococcus knuensis]
MKSVPAAGPTEPISNEPTSNELISNAARLRAFHAAIGERPVPAPTVPDGTLLALRRTLIREEFQEVEAEFALLEARVQAGEAVPAEDLTPLAHELVDLLYVTYGALDRLGVNADAVFAEVHRANMNKVSGPLRADGKILKPEGWQPADVRRVLREQLTPRDA